MSYTSLVKILKGNTNKDNKRSLLLNEVPLSVHNSFDSSDIDELSKIFSFIITVPSDINKKQEMDYIFSEIVFNSCPQLLFNDLLKNKTILNYFIDNPNISARGVFNAETKNLFTFYKRVKNPLFFSENNIYPHFININHNNVSATLNNLYEILKYSQGKEPLYLPYYIIKNSISSKNVLHLETGLALIKKDLDFQKIISPILWDIYDQWELESLIFLETNQESFKGFNICNADYICEFIEKYVYLATDDIKFFSYVLSQTYNRNKETVSMILAILENIPLSAPMFEFIYAFHQYLKQSNNSSLYILEEIITHNGVIELIEIIKD